MPVQINRLRPVFFRVGRSALICSGWIDVDTTNIWCALEDAKAHAQDTMTVDLQTSLALMSLVCNNNHGLVIVPQAALALTLGERVEFVGELDLFPADVVEVGERAVVGRRDRCTGAIELFLEHFHPKLDECSNCVQVTPHASQDILKLLRPYGDQWTAKVFVNLDEYKVA
jgi:hypothetical protein